MVVVNWNGAHLLGPCLRALAAQRTSFAYRVEVVDNASTDGSLDLLEREHPDVRVHRNAANLGYAGGNNTALRQVTTPFAVLLNNDAVPEPDWLERLLAPFDAPGGDRLAAVTSKVLFSPRFVRLRLEVGDSLEVADGPGVRVWSVQVDGRDVTGSVLWEALTLAPTGEGSDRSWRTRSSGELLVPVEGDGPHELALRWAADRPTHVRLSHEGGEAVLPAPAEPTTVALSVPADVRAVDVVNNAGSVVLRDGHGADRGYQEVDDGQYDAPAEVFALCGCAVAVRTDAGRAAGWFDDDFFLYYEDTDLSWRLRAAGWSIRYEPTAVVRHLHAATTGEWSPTFVFHNDRNRLLMLVKDARAGRALRAVGRYPLTTGSMALRTVRAAARTRTRPPLRPTALRLRVLGSFVRLLPATLRRRATGPRVVPRRELERWLVTTRDG